MSLRSVAPLHYQNDKEMDIKKAPVVNLSATLNRVLLMIIAIVIGILASYSTADAGVKIGKNPITQNIQKKKNHAYSCEELMKKHRNSSNIVVKSNQRRPKWR
jgi:hypothetical protein